VLLDAGIASDLPVELLTAKARAVVVPGPTMTEDARALLCDQLRDAGFSDVAMLKRPVEPSNSVAPARSMAAA